MNKKLRMCQSMLIFYMLEAGLPKLRLVSLLFEGTLLGNLPSPGKALAWAGQWRASMHSWMHSFARSDPPSL